MIWLAEAREDTRLSGPIVHFGAAKRPGKFWGVLLNFTMSLTQISAFLPDKKGQCQASVPALVPFYLSTWGSTNFHSK